MATAKVKQGVEVVNGERVKGSQPTEGITCVCISCGASFSPKVKYTITDERVKHDFFNGAFVGSEFVICPLCGKNNFF